MCVLHELGWFCSILAFSRNQIPKLYNATQQILEIDVYLIYKQAFLSRSSTVVL